jgi:photosystem II stability/assembly factor-like uncharacterized protein
MRSTRLLGAIAAATALGAALPGAAGANVQVGSSGWQWGNPLPQGNTLRTVSFAGPTGYAAGDFGTLLKTTDGGASWTGLPVGTFQSLTTVQVVDANTVVAGGGCVARRSVDGGKSFARIAFTPVESACKEPLVDLTFIDPATGWVLLADGSVFETADGGTQFSARTALPGTRAAGGAGSPTVLRFVSATSGYAANSLGQILQTTDAGQTWKIVSDTQRRVRDVRFVDGTHGFAVGDGGLFLRTTDGGATWTPKDIGAGANNLTSVRCATAVLCVVAQEDGKLLYKTADAGDTPLPPITPSTNPILAAAFTSDSGIVAVGVNGATVVSNDAGANFTQIGGALPAGKYFAIRAGAQPGTAYAPGDNGTLAVTTDGGKTWTRGNVTTSEAVVDVSFPNAQAGFALDQDGGLFSTTNAGGAWKTLDTGTTARPTAVYAPSPATVMVIGPRGVRRSTDSGGTFEQVRSRAVARAPLSGVDRAGGAIVAYGFQDLVRSTDGGAHWSALRKPGRYQRVRGRLVNRLGISQADFVDARHGFLRDTSGRLWKTRDGGRTWSELHGVGTEQSYGMAFSSASDGYLLIANFGVLDTPDERSGFLLRTTDGGVTWHPQYVIDQTIKPAGLASPGGAVDYLLGGDSALLSSTSGGDAGATSELTVTTSRRTVRKPAGITVTGKLAPAQGNELVTVSYRAPGTTRWRHQTVKTAANGAYTTSWRVARGTNLFVAQWQGDFKSAGDGSAVLSVKVRGRR